MPPLSPIRIERNPSVNGQEEYIKCCIKCYSRVGVPNKSPHLTEKVICKGCEQGPYIKHCDNCQKFTFTPNLLGIPLCFACRPTELKEETYWMKIGNENASWYCCCHLCQMQLTDYCFQVKCKQCIYNKEKIPQNEK